MTAPSGSTTPEPAAAAPGASAAAPATPPAEPATPATPATDPTPAAPAPRSLEDSLAGLEEDTRNHILSELARSRKEAADARGAKTRAVNDAKTEAYQSIGKALGLVTDQVDPAQLTEQLGLATTQAKQAQAELAVFKAANGKANVSALLDSRSFASQLAGIDPTDPAAVDALVSAAVEANPGMFGIAPAGDPRRLPLPNPAQGGGFTPNAPTLDDQMAAAVKAGDTREQIRIQNQKLASLPR